MLVLAPLVGSFLGVVIERLPPGRPVLFARSRCDHCGTTLAARDLIPLVSYLARRGRCACGEARLSPVYPVIELAAIVVALSAASVLSGWLLWVSLGLGWTLLTLALIDARHLILPDALTLPLIPAGLAVAHMTGSGLLLDHTIGAAGGLASFAGVAWTYRQVRGREGLGLGDAKLLAGAGSWLGWQALPGVVLAAAGLALTAALVRAMAGGKLAASSRIAFGPYLALACWLSWLLGPLLIG